MADIRGVTGSTRLPAKLASLLTSAQLKKVHHVTLGYEQSFLLTWRDVKGYEHIGMS